MEMIRRIGLPTLLASLAVLAIGAPSGASAAEVIGENGMPGPCSDDESYVQAKEADAPHYTPVAYGVITSWSAMAGATPGKTLRLLVMKPDPATGANNFIAVQKDEVRTLTIRNALNVFTTGVRLPIEPGERLGLYVPIQLDAAGPCDIPSRAAAGNELRWEFAHVDPPFGVSIDFGGDSTSRLNASAVVEPDADHDGFGDESQDGCPTNAATAGPCPLTAPTGQRSAAQEKCKKKKPKKARKKCQKKAKRLPV